MLASTLTTTHAYKLLRSCLCMSMCVYACASIYVKTREEEGEKERKEGNKGKEEEGTERKEFRGPTTINREI